MGDCVFCKIVKGEISAERVFESEDFIVIRDVNPKVEGHLLVIPREHYESLLDVPAELRGKFLDVVGELGVKDFNLVLNNGKIAGQVVSHVHLHVLPRREDDGFGVCA